MKFILFCSLLAGIQLYAANSDNQINVKVSNTKQYNLIYQNQNRLEKAKSLIAKQDTFYTNAYAKLIVEANIEINKIANPVTLKTIVPPSGNKHDYLSIAPYRWPNPNTADGFPWILKDGEINPMTRGNDTDIERLAELFGALNKLSMAYYFSGDIKYAAKARNLIEIWFLDDSTKVNPHLNYGQGIPGEFEGRRAALIEWNGMAHFITAVQILEADNVFSNNQKVLLKAWISDFYKWLNTSEFGKQNDEGLQNHSTNYDYIMIGLARYLGFDNEAKSRLEAAKIKRIETQIEPDGTQPRELGRTKSVHYCSMNLRLMTIIAEMGLPLGVDLWNYTSPKGGSIKKAYEYLRPFVQADKPWEYTQISAGGAEKAINLEMKPVFSIAEVIFDEQLIDKRANVYLSLSYIQRLQYPPVFK